MSLTFQPEGFRTIEDSMAYLGIRDDAGMTLIQPNTPQTPICY